MSTEAHRQLFQENGFVVVPSLFSADEVAALREHYMTLRQSPQQGDDIGINLDSADPLKRYPRMIHPHKWDETSRRFMFNEDKFWRQHNCILTHGGGQPPRGVRRMLHRLHYELKLPVYCLLDNDPWGYYIYSVIKQGSINLAYESRRMAIPDARFLGLRSNDYERCQLSPSVQIKLNEQDIKRARQIAQYPWFAHKKAWQKELDMMLKNGFKLEVEALISKDISYVTEQYVPARLREGVFLD
jgi:hypothetical protein